MTPNVLFIFLLSLFILGGIGIIVVNLKKEKQERQNAWIKYAVYFLVVNTLFASMMYCRVLSHALFVLIVLGSSYELIRLQLGSHRLKCFRFSVFFGIFTLVSLLFCLFGFWEKDFQTFTLLIVCTFDAFSQLSGQLFGKRKICPRISPEKTVGGTIGGTVVSMIVSAIAGYHSGWDIMKVSIMGLCIASASFAGDLAASFVKRQFTVKDFGRTFPGHGGFLDRFDSFIFAGAFVYLFQFCWR
jgi:phosphatidate cytidylyltransferase